MESFYGGRTGASFIIKKSYDCIKKNDDNKYQSSYYLYDPSDEGGKFKIFDKGQGGNSIVVPESLEKYLLERTDENYKTALDANPGCIWKEQLKNGDQINNSTQYNFQTKEAESMFDEFNKKASSTNIVNYGEYVLIDTVTNMHDKMNPANGQIYRRTMNFDNGLAGAEFIGQIAQQISDSYRAPIIGNYATVPTDSPEELAGDKEKAGWMITVGESPVEKTFYAYDYKAKNWYAVGTIRNDSTISASKVVLANGKTVEEKSSEWATARTGYLKQGNPNGTGSLSLNRKIEDENNGVIPVGQYSVAVGNNTTAEGDCAFAEGNTTQAIGPNSHAEGKKTKAIGEQSHVEGEDTISEGRYSHAEGYETTANKTASHTEGMWTVANGIASHAEGGNSSKAGTVEGGRTIQIPNADPINIRGSHTEGVNSHAEGKSTLAYGYASHSEGYETNAIGDHSHAEGNNTYAIGSNSHAEGYNSHAEVSYSHAEGDNTTASGNSSHAEGYKTEAQGNSSHAEGRSTHAEGDYSHAEGGSNNGWTYHIPNSDISGTIEGPWAQGNYTHAEGNNTIAYNAGSHSEGKNTIAYGENSHAEGELTTATGTSSHAEGNNTIAIQANSHTEGLGTIANYSCQHVQGKYNIKDQGARWAHVVGWGTSDTDRKNIHTITEDGNAWFAGTLKADDNVTFSNDLEVDGNVTFNNGLEVVNGNVTFSNNLEVDGNVTFNNDLEVNGNITFSNDLKVDGNVSISNLYSPVFNNALFCTTRVEKTQDIIEIMDSDGGYINIPLNDAPTGYTPIGVLGFDAKGVTGSSIPDREIFAYSAILDYEFDAILLLGTVCKVRIGQNGSTPHTEAKAIADILWVKNY